MRRLASSAFASAILLLGMNDVKANEIYMWDLGSRRDSDNYQHKIMYQYNTQTGVKTELLEYYSPNGGTSGKSSFVDPYEKRYT